MLKQGYINPGGTCPSDYILYEGAQYFYTGMEALSCRPPGAYNF